MGKFWFWPDQASNEQGNQGQSVDAPLPRLRLSCKESQDSFFIHCFRILSVLHSFNAHEMLVIK
jgi:hypothetical protein